MRGRRTPLILPIGDTPNPEGRAVVNYFLIAVNVAVFFIITLPLSMSPADPRDPAFIEYVRSIPQFREYSYRAVLQHVNAYDLFLFKNAFKPADPGLVSLITSMFLHGGGMHLIGNMLFLWIYGDNVENRLGSFRYLYAYLGAGIAATLFYSLFASHSKTPMIGASGAISGVLGFYYIWFPKNKVKMLFLLFPFFMDVILVPARLVLGFYLVVENLLPFIFSAQKGGGVAYGAHIGGFIAGVAVAYGLDRFPGFLNKTEFQQGGETVRQGEAGTDRQESKTERDEESTTLAHERISEAVTIGNLSRATAYYLALDSPRERLLVMPDDIMRIGDFLLKQHRYDHALLLFRRYIADHPTGPFLDWAYLGAGMSLLYGKGESGAAYQYFLQVLDVNPSAKAEQEALSQINKLKAKNEW